MTSRFTVSHDFLDTDNTNLTMFYSRDEIV